MIIGNRLAKAKHALKGRNRYQKPNCMAFSDIGDSYSLNRRLKRKEITYRNNESRAHLSDRYAIFASETTFKNLNYCCFKGYGTVHTSIYLTSQRK